MPQSRIPETVECATMPVKSVKQKSAALAKARKALKQFSGKLADPILFEQGSGLLGDMFEEREIAEKRGAKLGLLFAFYQISPNDKDRWIKLSGCLATDFVPGYDRDQIVFEKILIAPEKSKMDLRAVQWDDWDPIKLNPQLRNQLAVMAGVRLSLALLRPICT
jgi:hypothetical protein